MKDTITPLNYTKEAIKDLSVMEKGLRSNAPLTSYIMRQVIDMGSVWISKIIVR